MPAVGILRLPLPTECSWAGSALQTANGPGRARSVSPRDLPSYAACARTSGAGAAVNEGCAKERSWRGRGSCVKRIDVRTV